jgi:tartrate dehydrogenase/decarboxylase/D-malate dehydrogenase
MYRIAVIAGDGIGKEVVPEGVRALERAAARGGFDLQFDWFDFASCDYFLRHKKMMPDDSREKVGAHDAIYGESLPVDV